MMNHYTVTSGKTDQEIRRLVDEGETIFNSQLCEVANRLAAIPELRLIGLTGPTCSGKTTAANKLTAEMKKYGKKVHTISIDDFYYDKEHLVKLAKEKGLDSLDYDSEDTIDVDFLRECANSLIEGKKTAFPHFNFHTGLRETGEIITPEPNDLFLFEGIQILYPSVDQILSRGGGYRSIYICPASSVTAGGVCFLPNEIRLMRRLVRDFRYRATMPEFTFFLWESVRDNEEKNIFPYVERCHMRVDSTMPYEIGMLKPFLENVLQKMPENSRFVQKGTDILARLCEVQPIPAELIPENSLYKEFI